MSKRRKAKAKPLDGTLEITPVGEAILSEIAAAPVLPAGNLPILQRRPGEAAAIAVPVRRCEVCQHWTLRETVLSPIVRGNCARIRPPQSAAAAELETGPLLGVANIGGATVFVGLITPPAFSCSLFERRRRNVTDEQLHAAELVAHFRHDPPWGGYVELLTSPVQFRIYSRHALASLKDDDHPDTRDKLQQAARLLEQFHKDNPQ